MGETAQWEQQQELREEGLQGFLEGWAPFFLSNRVFGICIDGW